MFYTASIVSKGAMKKIRDESHDDSNEFFLPPLFAI